MFSLTKKEKEKVQSKKSREPEVFLLVEGLPKKQRDTFKREMKQYLKDNGVRTLNDYWKMVITDAMMNPTYYVKLAKKSHTHA